MELNHLKYFFEVVREGNFTKASRSLQVAQPAISRTVKHLEESLGGDLLIRHKRHVELTPLGNAVLRHAKSIFEEVEQIRSLSSLRADKVEGPLLLGTSDAIASGLLPEWLVRFTDEHESVLPLVSVGPAGELLQKIHLGDLDVGLFFHVPEIPGLNLQVTPLMDVPYRFVVRKSVAKNPKVLSSFIGSREIDSPSNLSYPTLDKLKKKHPAARIRFSTNNLSLHKELVILGKGVAVLPEFLVAKDLKNGILQDVLPGEKFRFKLKTVRHKVRPLRACTLKFLTTLNLP